MRCDELAVGRTHSERLIALVSFHEVRGQLLRTCGPRGTGEVGGCFQLVIE
jgi:hypothetical protein